MDLNLRLAALSKLMDAASEEADKRIVQEFGKAENVLQQSTEFDELSGALKTLSVLAPKFHRAIVPLLTTFVRSVGPKTLTQRDAPLSRSLGRYQTASVLIREAIEVAEQIRYLNTEEVLDFLLELSRSSDQNVRSKTQQAMQKLAEFNIDVFFGEHGQGAGPQARIVAHLSRLDRAQLVADGAAILEVLAAVLSPSMEGTSWTYNKLTIRKGAIPTAHGVAEMRSTAIALLKEMYRLSASVNYRKSVLRTLGSATRRERASDDPETLKMFVRDAIEVLSFLRDLVATEALPLVQVIEHDGYWNYYHAASHEVEMAALEARDAIALNAEYQIYKLLIGFEGIFGKWEELKRSESAWDYSDSHRHAAAERFVTEINDANQTQWRDRILEFSRTQSDDLATFPVYYSFLEAVGRKRPQLALELVTEHEGVMTPFLIALMRGLYGSARSDQIDAVVARWIAEAKHLSAIAKSMHKGGASRLPTLVEVIERASSAGNHAAIANAMEVAATLYSEGTKAAKGVFMRALRAFGKEESAKWVLGIWYSREFRALISELDSSERAELLSALASLRKINYQAEEILFSIAKYDAQSVLAYLLARLAEERTRLQREPERSVLDDDHYEAIPFQLHKLNEPLAKAPEVVIAALRQDFASEDPFMFTYRGARLVKGIFPTFGGPLESELRKLIDGGDPNDIDFVLAILRTYEGSAAILEVGKAIVKAVPERSESWNELAAAIETTGVVSGEYGFVQAYERKRGEIEPWKTDENVRVRAFAEWLIASLDHMIDSERKRADEELALRKYKYGVGDESPPPDH